MNQIAPFDIIKKSLSILLGVYFMSFSYAGFTQSDYLEKGNKYLAEENYGLAEKTFREAVKADSSNLIYRSQLALALMNQGKHKEAQVEIDLVLAKDSLNSGALWYGGVNNFIDKTADLRTAIRYFEKVLPLLNEKQGQYYSANWFIGRSYNILLQSEGLSYNEVSRMIECYSTYVKLQPNAKDAAAISAFIDRVKDIRPPENVKKWVYKGS